MLSIRDGTQENHNLPRQHIMLETLKPAVPYEIIEKLGTAGVKYLPELVMRGSKIVSQISGISLPDSMSVCREALKQLQRSGILPQGFISMAELKNQRQEKTDAISTGSREFDDLLGGRGFKTGSIYEIYGGSKTGKTQLCLSLCTIVQQKSGEGGLEGGAICLDSEGSFSANRMVGIANARGLNPELALQSTVLQRIYNGAHMEEAIYTLASAIEEERNFRLVIVDSLISPFRVEYQKRAELGARQQALNRCLNALSLLATIYNVCVVFTNQVQSSIDPYYNTSALVPIGGNVMAHGSNYRLCLKECGRNRIARLVKSSSDAEREILFTISDKGISDLDH